MNAEKLQQAVALYDRMKTRFNGRLPEHEISNFVSLFLVAMEEMEKLQKEQRP